MKTTVRFDGGAELARAFESLSKSLGKRQKYDALEMAGEPIRRTMGQMAPRRAPQPDLADNMVMSPAKSSGPTEAAIAIGPEKSFFYGRHQEFGTVHHGPQAFARPSFDQHVGGGSTLDLIRRACWTALAAVGISRTVSAPNSGDLT